MFNCSVYSYFLPTEIRKLINCAIFARSRINQENNLTPLIIQHCTGTLSQERYDQQQAFNYLVLLALRIRPDVFQYNID
jgi:hypothetical protein